MNGVLNVRKETGYTSHDVVARLRGILHQKKIGHTGTLDPDAVGVLPVCIGRATKLVETLSGGGKTYETTLLLGLETDTQDISGTVLSQRDVHCTEDDLRRVLEDFRGEQDQIPPMYSAKKVNGKRLYTLAREGKTISRAPARIRIDELELLSFALPRAKLRITCSSGTYIRTLCNDIGNALGCGGCMEELVRTRSGQFRLEEAHSLGEIEQYAKEGRVEEILLPVAWFFRELPLFRTLPDLDAPARCGNQIPEEKLVPAEKKDVAYDVTGLPQRMRLCDSGGSFLGIYVKEEGKRRYRPALFLYEGNEQN